jgi:hypothetical protein
MEGVTVCLAKYGDRRNAHFTRGSHNPQGDFSPVGYENFPDFRHELGLNHKSTHILPGGKGAPQPILPDFCLFLRRFTMNCVW